MGGEDGFFTRYPALGGAAPTVTLASMPYTRTVTCTGSYTLTGTATESPSSVSWSASPSGDSGSCTGTSSFSCVVAIAPNAAGEGVETITVTATNGTGNGTDTETIGFYVNGAHSCFLSQSVDNSYNSTLANNDPVTTWKNLGSSALNITQATGSAKPTFLTSFTASQPIVSFDGGDVLVSSAASTSWDFLSKNPVTMESVFDFPTDNGNNMAVSSTFLAAGSLIASDFRTTAVGNAVISVGGSDPTGTGAFYAGVLHLSQTIRDDSGTPDINSYTNGTLMATGATGANEAAAETFRLGDSGNSIVTFLTGYIYRFVAYSSALSTTQIQINEAVDEWALNASLPVTP